MNFALLPKDVVDSLDRNERIKITLLFMFFFLVIGAFWTMKPLRTSSVIRSFGTDYYPLFKQGIVILAPILMGAFTSLTCYFNREQFVYFFTSIFLVLAWVFWGLIEFVPSPIVNILFYYFVDAYITLMVVLFFSYLNDVYSAGEAKKYYGIIGMGGLLGGMVGQGVSGWASEILGNHIILMVTFFLVPICLIVRKLQSICPDPGTATICPPQGKSKTQRFTEGMKAVFSSRYLIGIVAIIGLYEIVSTSVDYQFTAAIAESFKDQDKSAMSAFQGKVFFYASLVALVVQLFVTTWVHRIKGILVGLLFLPVGILIGSAGFLVLPVLALITITIGSEAAFAYSINQSTREILWVPLDSVARFKSKAFIDIFVLRFAKAFGALYLLTYTLYLSKIGFTTKFLMGTNIIAITVWLAAIVYVSRAFNKYSQEESVGERAEVDASKMVA